MTDVIDLRKINRSQLRNVPPYENPEIREEPKRLAPTVEKLANTLLSWSAYEYERRERGTSWYVGAGILAAGLAALGILAKSYFFVAFVALAFAVLVAYTKRPPRELKIEISPEGIRVGNRLYEFSQITSFWIFEKPEFKELSVETKQTFQPYLRLPFGDTDPQKLREILTPHIPEKEHQETFIDQLARSLGF